MSDKCHHCGNEIRNHRFYNFNAGILKNLAPNFSQIITTETNYEFFIDMSVHDGYKVSGGTNIQILEDIPVHHHQVDIYFCSKECLRDWFVNKVNQLPDLTRE